MSERLHECNCYNRHKCERDGCKKCCECGCVMIEDSVPLATPDGKDGWVTIETYREEYELRISLKERIEELEKETKKWFDAWQSTGQMLHEQDTYAAILMTERDELNEKIKSLQSQVYKLERSINLLIDSDQTKVGGSTLWTSDPKTWTKLNIPLSREEVVRILEANLDIFRETTNE